MVTPIWGYCERDAKRQKTETENIYDGIECTKCSKGMPCNVLQGLKIMESKCIICEETECYGTGCMENNNCICFGCLEVPTPFHKRENCPCKNLVVENKNRWACPANLAPNSLSNYNWGDRIKRTLLVNYKGTIDEKKKYLEKLCRDQDSWFKAMHKSLDGGMKQMRCGRN